MHRNSLGRLYGPLLVVASACCFGTLSSFTKLVYSHGGDALSLLFVRFVVSFLVLAALATAAHGRSRVGYAPRPRVLVAGFLLGLTFYVGQSLSFFEGLARAPAGLVVLLFYIWPLFATLGGALVFGEELTSARVAILLIGLSGIALCVGLPSHSTGLGVALGLAAGIFYSGYVLGSKRLLNDGLSAVQLTAAAFLGPALVYSGVAAVRGVQLPSGVVGWGTLSGVVVLGTIVPTLLLFAGLARVEAGSASILSTAEPLTGVVLAYVILGESMSGLQLLGGALVLGAVVALALAPAHGPDRIKSRKLKL